MPINGQSQRIYCKIYNKMHPNSYDKKNAYSKKPIFIILAPIFVLIL